MMAWYILSRDSSSPGGWGEATIVAGSSRGMSDFSPLSVLRAPIAFRSGLSEAFFLGTFLGVPLELGLLELLRVMSGPINCLRAGYETLVTKMVYFSR